MDGHRWKKVRSRRLFEHLGEMMPKPFHITTVLLDLEGPLASAAGGRRVPRTLGKALIRMLRANGLGVGAVSRCTQKAALGFLEHRFQIRPCIGLDAPGASRRRRNPFQAAARSMRIPAQRFMVVSANRDVLRLAKDAGAVAVEWCPDGTLDPSEPVADYRIADLPQLNRLIRMGVALPAGKLPNDLLQEFLDDIVFDDPALLINPGVGEDIAAVDVAREEVLVLKSDPITFATDAIGHYTVLVNANDIATAGATPRWLLTTLLFPVGSTPSLVLSVIAELKESCRKWGITLCGGHTEVTAAVARPVVCGMMAGSVRKRDLIDKRRMRPGDRVLLTKAAAVEGTAIIARELGSRLRKLGMRAEDIEAARAYLDRVSIIPEARQAARCPGTSAMHDVTEGGIATALEELSAAGGCRLRVDVDRIPVFPETRRICRLLGVHPLGLIGSGSLLICCRPKHADRLQHGLHRAGIAVTCIGAVLEKGTGVEALRSGRPTRWHSFEVDEIARLFSRQPDG
jgi:hydrogenase expression/formation protein HypE